jgi:hypothetical protein
MDRDELIEVGWQALAAIDDVQRGHAMVVAVIDATEPMIRADERERLAQKWSEDSHGVRFNHAHDDLTPHQRVLKWIRGIT